MNRNKYLYTILLFVLLLPVGRATAEPVYTRAQVDSIVAAEVSRQLAAEQIDLKIERSANERYALALSEQDNRLTEHDHEMSTRYTWMSIIFTVLVALTGFFVPYIVNKRYEERLKEIADNNENKINDSVNEKTAELNAKTSELNNRTSELNKKIADMDNNIKAHDKRLNEVSNQVNESAKQAKTSQDAAVKAAIKAKASALISQAKEEEDLDEKIRLLKAAIELDAENAEAYRRLGWVYNEKKEYDEAIRYLKKSIELNPLNSTSHNNLGFSYRKNGKIDDAILCFLKAIELNPQNSIAYNNLGWAYSGKKELDKSIENYSIAIDLNPQYFLAYKNRGLIYQAKANQEQDQSKKAEYEQLAKADLQKAKELKEKPEE